MNRVETSISTDKQNFDVEFNLSDISLIKDIKRLSVEIFEQIIEKEVESVCGKKYERGLSFSRWGFNPGSVCFEDGKVKVQVPRVMNKKTKTCYRLKTYEKLKNHESFEESVYAKILHGISTRDYPKVVSIIANQFGFSKSSVSRHYLKVAEKKLAEFNTRDLSNLDIVSIFIDGKRFSSSGLILALGVDITGKKHYLGFVESSTENSKVMSEFFELLEARGLSTENEILFVIDGSKGFFKSIQDHFGKRAFVQRCQWHKRKNVISYLPKKHQDHFRMKIQRAYEKSSYKEAKEALMKIHKELLLLNRSAATSLMEGFEETLTLHTLNLFDELGRSFKTTNVLESVNRQIQKFGYKVTNWKSSRQIQGRVASILLENEHNLSKVCGHDCMAELREKMKDQTAKKIAA